MKVKIKRLAEDGTETIEEAELAEGEELHTAHEIELEKQISALGEQIEKLTQTNKELYLKFGGSDGEEAPEKTANELLTEMVQSYIKGGFNEAVLQGGLE